MKSHKCERCGTRNDMTKHHILPKRWFHGIGGISYLCRTCHDEIEIRIAKTEHVASGSENRSMRHRLQPYEYREILNDFITERRLYGPRIT